MKKWTDAELVTLEINATAYGKNPQAREANANKHPNNGAGGRQDNNNFDDDSNDNPVTQPSSF